MYEALKVGGPVCGIWRGESLSGHNWRRLLHLRVSLLQKSQTEDIQTQNAKRSQAAKSSKEDLLKDGTRSRAARSTTVTVGLNSAEGSRRQLGASR